jgi:hypothetical protein
MRKIPIEYENPIDNILIDLADKACPYFKQNNCIPNEISIISLFLGLFSAYQLFIDNNILAGIFWILSYWFDCLDGHYARKYNMETVLGDYIDHVSDLIKICAIIYVFIYKYNFIAWKLYLVLIVMTVLSLSHLGCQELYYDEITHIDAPLIGVYKCLCPYDDAKKALKITKYVGCGTVNIIVMCMCMFYNNKLYNNL